MHQIRIRDAESQFSTTAKRAQRVQQYYSRELLEANADAVVLTDTDGIIFDVNQQMIEITGCARSKLIGSNWFDFCPDTLAAHVAFAHALTEAHIYNVDLAIKGRCGNETQITYNASSIYDRKANLIGVFATLRDLTELNCIKQSLEAKTVEVEHAAQMKSAFVATMSHELRTPLTAILGFSEALLCGILGNIAEGQKEYIRDIHDSGQHLLDLINDILDMAQIDAGMMQLHLETADLGDVVANCAASASPLTTSLIEVLVDDSTGPIVAELDLRKMQKMVGHMLSNAIKFSAPDGDIRLHVSKVPRSSVGRITDNQSLYGFPLAASEHGEFIQLTVHDSGVGISPQNLPDVFQPFTQIESGLARRFEGVGIGATMVQRLAELHDGTTAITSIEGEGTSFTVWLPIRKAKCLRRIKADRS